MKNECFPIVEAQVATAGRSVVIGWMLWEMPGIFVEAEFHAVRSPHGTDLLDLTPKSAPVAHILFLPDPTRKYEGRQVSNLRRPVRQDPAVQGYLDTFFEEFELKNRGKRAFQHGELDLNTEELKQLAAILGRRQTFGREMGIPDVWAYGPCSCSSGRKRSGATSTTYDGDIRVDQLLCTGGTFTVTCDNPASWQRLRVRGVTLHLGRSDRNHRSEMVGIARLWSRCKSIRIAPVSCASP